MPNTAVFLDIDWTLGHSQTQGTIGYNEEIEFSRAEQTRLNELEALAKEAQSMPDGDRIDFCIMTSNCYWNKEKMLAEMKVRCPTLYANVRATEDKIKNHFEREERGTGQKRLTQLTCGVMSTELMGPTILGGAKSENCGDGGPNARFTKDKKAMALHGAIGYDEAILVDDESGNIKAFNSQDGCLGIQAKKDSGEGLKANILNQRGKIRGKIPGDASSKALGEFKTWLDRAMGTIRLLKAREMGSQAEFPPSVDSKNDDTSSTVALRNDLQNQESFHRILDLVKKLQSPSLSFDISQARDIVNTIMSDDAKKHQKESEVSFPEAIEVMKGYKQAKSNATFNDPAKLILAIKALRDAKHAGMGTRWFSSDKKRYQQFENAYKSLSEADKTVFKNMVDVQMRGELNESVRGIFKRVTRTMKNVERITGLSSLPNTALGDGTQSHLKGRNSL